jgi:dTDP-4-dehydrorhamnose 3,5-epimerase
MELVSLAINGTFGIIAETHEDTRGTLTRVWDKNSILGDFKLIQSSIAINPKSKTIRGLHFQSIPFSENKIVKCVSGRVFDVIVDLRQDSSTYKEHLTIELGPSASFLGVFIPSGCAHGYLTLEDNSTLIYFMDQEYSLEHSRGLLWSDPSLSIDWPSDPSLISERDSKWPTLD